MARKPLDFITLFEMRALLIFFLDCFALLSARLAMTKAVVSYHKNYSLLKT